MSVEGNDVEMNGRTAEERAIRERILDIVVKEGLVDRSRLVGSATLEELGVQSIDVVVMLNAFEDEFEIYVPIDQTMNDVKCLDDLVAVIEQLVKNPQPAPQNDR